MNTCGWPWNFCLNELSYNITYKILARRAMSTWKFVRGFMDFPNLAW